MTEWLIITPEFPPTVGGVADYTAQVAQGLAEYADAVQVWAPAPSRPLAAAKLVVHELSTGFDRQARRAIDAALAKASEPILLLQYVPLGFGRFSPGFFHWLRRRRQRLWVMFHEVAFPFAAGQRLRHRLLAGMTHATARGLLARAEQIFCSTRAWEDMVHRLDWSGPAPVWLPVPSNLPCTPPRPAPEVRAELGLPSDAPVVAHFGSYGPHLRGVVQAVTSGLLEQDPTLRCLLVGRGADSFAESAFSRDDPARARLVAVGEASHARLAELISAADVLFYPFGEGATTRRGSLMAALALGKAAVTTEGRLADRIWAETGCVELSSQASAELVQRIRGLLSDPSRRRALEQRARATYAEHFAIEHTVQKLRAAAARFV